MTRLAIMFVATLVVGMSAIASNRAEAAGFGIYIGGNGYGYSGDSYYGGYRTAYYPTRAFYADGWDSDHVWHDTSHYDYHPGRFERHRNHFHYVPGHYDYHETGHVHHLHP